MPSWFPEHRESAMNSSSTYVNKLRPIRLAMTLCVFVSMANNLYAQLSAEDQPWKAKAINDCRQSIVELLKNVQNSDEWKNKSARFFPAKRAALVLALLDCEEARLPLDHEFAANEKKQFATDYLAVEMPTISEKPHFQAAYLLWAAVRLRDLSDQQRAFIPKYVKLLDPEAKGWGYKKHVHADCTSAVLRALLEAKARGSIRNNVMNGIEALEKLVDVKRKQVKYANHDDRLEEIHNARHTWAFNTLDFARSMEPPPYKVDSNIFWKDRLPQYGFNFEKEFEDAYFDIFAFEILDYIQRNQRLDVLNQNSVKTFLDAKRNKDSSIVGLFYDCWEIRWRCKLYQLLTNPFKPFTSVHLSAGSPPLLVLALEDPPAAAHAIRVTVDSSIAGALIPVEKAANGLAEIALKGEFWKVVLANTNTEVQVQLVDIDGGPVSGKVSAERSQIKKP